MRDSDSYHYDGYDEFDEVVARLYAGVLSVPLDAFRAFGFERLAELIKFDSAVWVSYRAYPQAAGTAILDIHTMSIIGQDQSVPIRFGTEFKDHDLVSQMAMATPGEPVCIEDTMSIEDYRSSFLYVNFAQALGIEYTMGVAIGDPLLNIWQGIVLWRSDRARPFTPAERILKKRFAGHMHNAWRQRQFLEISGKDERRQNGEALMVAAHAITDWKGAICTAEPQFGKLMTSCFPEWTGPDLPPDIAALVKGGMMSAVIGRLEIELVGRDDFCHVIARTPRDSSPLSHAELEVAKLFAAGHSSGKIAMLRGVSSATIRNQISSIYTKLRINSKVELINRLH
ncbi:helix-turn-helix transcriptional regulator [Sphingomonas cavernae]|uniref:LuxR family transcriptional regulator n=1 Tax=Sphingomonas cavernae TaxID=2320861 RepID=A0A418WMV0_9SPHN|nr:helix-turn-helix transcriptional regulator [Sphingomonas cavernae]RJF91328.1 LuxR family transcriptional regulator [Sphingomonas cavernae]